MNEWEILIRVSTVKSAIWKYFGVLIETIEINSNSLQLPFFCITPVFR